MDENGVPSLNDIAKVTDSTSGLIRVISAAFPGVAMRSTVKAESKITKRTMGDIAAAKKFGEEVGLSEESIDALCDDIYRRNTRRERFERVIEFASDSIEPDTKLYDLETSWAEDFREHAEKACDEEAQRMWGAILAGEMESPGSFSKRTMDILSKMSRQEAESFATLCQNTTYVFKKNSIRGYTDNPLIALFLDVGFSSYNYREMSVDEISTLSSIGLIDKAVDAHLPFVKNQKMVLYTQSRYLIVSNTSGKDKEMVFKAGAFLEPGIELAKVCGVGDGMIVDEVLEEELAAAGFEVTSSEENPFDRLSNNTDGATDDRERSLTRGI